MSPQHQQAYISAARLAAQNLWNAVNTLASMQAEWNALNYGSTLPDGTGNNSGVLATDVGSVVFATTNAIMTLFGTGHATNLAKLL